MEPTATAVWQYTEVDRWRWSPSIQVKSNIKIAAGLKPLLYTDILTIAGEKQIIVLNLKFFFIENKVAFFFFTTHTFVHLHTSVD